jgi:hypothetical protein
MYGAKIRRLSPDLKPVGAQPLYFFALVIEFIYNTVSGYSIGQIY